jgi:small subunit ribosomal protein S8e
VVYYPSDNDLVQIIALTGGSVIVVDAAPFKTWWGHVYGKALGRSTYANDEDVDPAVVSQMEQRRMYLIISSRPGQCGRADGYILEGEELQFYLQHLTKNTS